MLYKCLVGSNIHIGQNIELTAAFFIRWTFPDNCCKVLLSNFCLRTFFSALSAFLETKGLYIGMGESLEKKVRTCRGRDSSCSVCPSSSRPKRLRNCRSLPATKKPTVHKPLLQWTGLVFLGRETNKGSPLVNTPLGCAKPLASPWCRGGELEASLNIDWAPNLRRKPLLRLVRRAYN